MFADSYTKFNGNGKSTAAPPKLTIVPQAES